MGGGSWTRDSFARYSSSMGRSYDAATDSIKGDISNQEMFKSRSIDPLLNPKGVMRECRDSDEHPRTLPVILGLDLTGSMGNAGVEVAKKISQIVSTLFEEVPDVQIMVMGIGDFDYDRGPLQVGQFESDVRIASQLDKLWFEKNGGGNHFESYTAAWEFGISQCDLDCWKRGKKGLIITTGDEPLNPYLPKVKYDSITGTNHQNDISTQELYQAASEKYDIYHISVDDRSTMYNYYGKRTDNAWTRVINPQCYRVAKLNEIADTIINIVKNHASMQEASTPIGFIDDSKEPTVPFVGSEEMNQSTSNEISW